MWMFFSAYASQSEFLTTLTALPLAFFIIFRPCISIELLLVLTCSVDAFLILKMFSLSDQRTNGKGKGHNLDEFLVVNLASFLAGCMSLIRVFRSKLLHLKMGMRLYICGDRNFCFLIGTIPKGMLLFNSLSKIAQQDLRWH